MSGYRPARFGPDFYESPAVNSEFNSEDITKTLAAVKLPVCEFTQNDPAILASMLRNVAHLYFLAASNEAKDQTAKEQLKAYVAELNIALDGLYLALGADRTRGLVAATGTLKPDQTYERQVMLHHDWDAGKELIALNRLADAHRARDWFNRAANVSPEIALGSRNLLTDQRILIQALAGVDAVAAIVTAGQRAFKALPGSRGGRLSPKDFRNFLFKELCALFRKTYGCEPESKKKDGEYYVGTWNDWLGAILPEINKWLKNLNVPSHLLPTPQTWAGALAYEWLKAEERRVAAQKIEAE